MKRSHALIAIVALGTASAVLAMPGGKHHHRHDGHGAERMARVMEKAGVSDEQQTQIKQIREDRRDGMKVLKQRQREQRRALHELDPSTQQYTGQVDALAQQIGHTKADMVRYRSETRRLTAQVLTPDQRAQIKQIREAKREKRKMKREERKNHAS